MFGKKKGFVFTTKNIARSTGNGDRIGSNSSEMNMNNFLSIDQAIRDQAISQSYSSSIGGVMTSSGESTGLSASATKPERIAVEPKAVFDQIKRETPEISFDNLEEKIAVVENRIEILREHLDESHLKDEHRALFYLKNRFKYLSTMKKNPLDWAMTTQEAVNDLCSRYKLQVVPLKQYYTLVPSEGLKEMNRYTKAYKAITGDNPIFELVIKDTAVLPTEEAKKTKKKDRDPILLANSPLGNFLFVLGAWDEEVEVVDEIIYGSK